MNYKNKLISTVVIQLIVLLIFMLIINRNDPFLYYNSNWETKIIHLNNSNYQNPGILKNFHYDSFITGTSMTQNFNVDEANTLFNASFVKTPIAGGSFYDINKLKNVAFNNRKINNVIQAIDYSMIKIGHETSNVKEVSYYLYDNNIFNDIYYLLNIDVMCSIVKNYLNYNFFHMDPIDNFNEAYTWHQHWKFSKDTVLKNYKRQEIKQSTNKLDENTIDNIRKNINNNLKQQAIDNPDTNFYFFFTPYSILYYDELFLKSEYDAFYEIKDIVVGELIAQENIKLFSFELEDDIIYNLDNYKDVAHYSDKINSRILQYMSKDKYLLTADNYKEILKKEKIMISNVNFDQLYE